MSDPKHIYTTDNEIFLIIILNFQSDQTTLLLLIIFLVYCSDTLFDDTKRSVSDDLESWIQHRKVDTKKAASTFSQKRAIVDALERG